MITDTVYNAKLSKITEQVIAASTSINFEDLRKKRGSALGADERTKYLNNIRALSADLDTYVKELLEFEKAIAPFAEKPIRY